MLVVGRLSPRH